MVEKTALWSRVCRTNPRHVKQITGKDYGGNSPKPYYIVKRLTDEFGPCGIGWGYSIDSERFERFSDTDVLHIARVTLWYDLDGHRGQVTQMGQTKATYQTKDGKFKVDEDAPKKSVTDALVKCASYLGFAGDIFAGRWDDSRYVDAVAAHFAQNPEPDFDDAPRQPRPVQNGHAANGNGHARNAAPPPKRPTPEADALGRYFRDTLKLTAPAMLTPLLEAGSGLEVSTMDELRAREDSDSCARVIRSTLEAMVAAGKTPQQIREWADKTVREAREESQIPY